MARCSNVKQCSEDLIFFMSLGPSKCTLCYQNTIIEFRVSIQKHRIEVTRNYREVASRLHLLGGLHAKKHTWAQIIGRTPQKLRIQNSVYLITCSKM